MVYCDASFYRRRAGIAAVRRVAGRVVWAVYARVRCSGSHDAERAAVALATLELARWEGRKRLIDSTVILAQGVHDYAAMRKYTISILAMVVIASSACASGGLTPRAIYRGTFITPEHFRFATIVEAGDVPYYDGGWRAVCIQASVSQGVSYGGAERPSSQYTCDLEFGVPIVLRDGTRIPYKDAQRKAANAAATQVVTTTKGITAATCIQIRRTAQRLLRKAIRGSRVGPCGASRSTVPVPVVKWP